VIFLFGFLSGVCFANLGWLVPSAIANGGATVSAAIALAVFGTIFGGIGLVFEITSESTNAPAASRNSTPEAKA
jgi:hypothetical protein